MGRADAAGNVVGREPDDDAVLWRRQCGSMRGMFSKANTRRLS